MIEKDLILDKRIIQRNIDRGRLTEQEYQEALGNLPDLEDGAEEITVEVTEGEFKVDFPEPEE